MQQDTVAIYLADKAAWDEMQAEMRAIYGVTLSGWPREIAGYLMQEAALLNQRRSALGIKTFFE